VLMAVGRGRCALEFADENAIGIDGSEARRIAKPGIRPSAAAQSAATAISSGRIAKNVQVISCVTQRSASEGILNVNLVRYRRIIIACRS